MTMIKYSPCYGCTERNPGCHDRCVRYAEYKAKSEALKPKVSDADIVHRKHMRKLQKRFGPI